MSVKKSLASKNVLNNAARRAIVAAVGSNPIERLESRQLLSATLTLVNPENLPSPNRVIFNYVQNPDPNVPNVVHSQQALQIEDTGTTPLVISSMALSGPWAFVNAPAGGYTNVTINPGAPLTITLAFTQRSLPAHTYNETNFTTTPDGGAEINGTLTINSNDPAVPSTQVALAGYWQDVSNNNTEPSLQTIVNLLSGYKTVINSTPIPDLSEPSGANVYGSEVTATSWEPAIPTQPVALQQIGAFRTEGNNASVYWYTASGQQSHLLFTDAANQGQSLLPTLSNGGLAESSFTPTGAFGLRVDNEYSADAINNAAGNTGGGGHHFRFFPLVSSTGATIPNTYIVTMDYGTLQTENFDFQDNVFIVSNIRPSTTPETPSNFTATAGAHPVLTWTADSYSPVAYNIYSTATFGGTYSLLTPTPITTNTYTDTANTGTPAYYEVVAVDTTQTPVAASFPATTSANTGPVTSGLTYNVYTSQPFTFNPLINDSDPTGTLNVATVTVTAPNHGGTAVVNTTSGLITYTSAANFTGTETFNYTVTDSNGQVSTPATITINVGTTINIAPVANNEVTTTLETTAVNIPVLSVDLPVSTFNVSSLAITTQPAHGSVVLNGDGSVTYTPAGTFIGGDEFQYTIGDNNGQTSNIGTVNINVGVEISSAKGAAHSVTYTDEDGVATTITLNKGVADVYFDGAGTVGLAVKNTLPVTGTSLRARQITLSQTTSASVLKISGYKGGQVNLGGISDTGALGSIVAPGANLRAVGSTSLSGLSAISHSLTPAVELVASPIAAAGTIQLAGVKSISLRTANTGNIILGAAGVKSTSLSFVGTVTDVDVTSSVPITSLKAGAWLVNQYQAELISAPSIGTLSVAGEFDPGLSLTASGKSTSLNSAKIGTAAVGSWIIAGNVHAVSLVNVSPSWGGVDAAGNLASFSVTKGNLPADITAGSINSLKVNGLLSSDITTTGNLLSLSAVEMVGALIDVGSTSDEYYGCNAFQYRHRIIEEHQGDRRGCQQLLRYQRGGGCDRRIQHRSSERFERYDSRRIGRPRDQERKGERRRRDCLPERSYPCQRRFARRVLVRQGQNTGHVRYRYRNGGHSRLIELI